MNNPAAFPSSNEVKVGNCISSGHRGMTLLDYFAAKAMQSFLDEVGSGSDQRFYKDIAIASYEVADAMLKAREA